MKIGFAGAGNMAAALARGWAGSPEGPEAMLFCDAGSGRAARATRPWPSADAFGIAAAHRLLHLGDGPQCVAEQQSVGA